MLQIWLTTHELAERWRTSPETLRYHRYVGKGVASAKFGRRVLYRLEDVEAYEREHLRGAAAAVENVPGYEGSVGPFGTQRAQPHVYARGIHSGAGSCICGQLLGADRHTEAAPGVPVPKAMRR